MKKYKYGLFFLLLILGIAANYFYEAFNRKATDLLNKNADIKITASVLLKDYLNNEADANKKYNGKIIEVDGSIVDIQHQQDSSVSIIVGDTLQMSKVSCLLSNKKNNDAADYKIGNLAVIKGICTGYLMDVNLNECVIIKSKK